MLSEGDWLKMSQAYYLILYLLIFTLNTRPYLTQMCYPIVFTMWR